VLERPTPEECEFAVLELGKLHPDVIEKCREIRERTTVTTNVASDCKIDKDIVPDGVGSGAKDEADDFRASSCGDQTGILDGVFSTMLSQNTTAANSTRAFGNFKKAVPDWSLVAEDFEGYQQIIETAIHCGGLAQIKAANIIRLCRTVHEETGKVSLEYLREKSNKAIKKDLIRHKGLGPKTISCVLLFTLGRNEFPVDTHVYRITKQHKWLPNGAGASRDAAYDYLNERIPDHLKLELHCLLVQHGRECHRCAARGKPQFPPADGSKLDCPLVHLNAIAAEAASNHNAAKKSKISKIKKEI
jgi:endonuclease-3